MFFTSSFLALRFYRARSQRKMSQRVTLDFVASVPDEQLDTLQKNSAAFPEGGTLLMHAAEHNDVPMLEMLLARGADPNIRDDHANTALMAAAFHGSVECLKRLLDAGAKTDLVDAPRHVGDWSGNALVHAMR